MASSDLTPIPRPAHLLHLGEVVGVNKHPCTLHVREQLPERLVVALVAVPQRPAHVVTHASPGGRLQLRLESRPQLPRGLKDQAGYVDDKHNNVRNGFALELLRTNESLL